MRLTHAQQECRDWLLAQPPGGIAVVAYVPEQPGPLARAGFSIVLASLFIEQPVAKAMVFTLNNRDRLGWFACVSNLLPTDQVIKAHIGYEIQFQRGANVYSITFNLPDDNPGGPFDRVFVDGGLPRFANGAARLTQAGQMIVGVRLGHVDPAERAQRMAERERALREANKAADNDFALFEWGVGERPVRVRLPEVAAEGEN